MKREKKSLSKPPEIERDEGVIESVRALNDQIIDTLEKKLKEQGLSVTETVAISRELRALRGIPDDPRDTPFVMSRQEIQAEIMRLRSLIGA